MTKWNGDEIHEMPHRYEVLEMLREELDERDERIIKRLDRITENQTCVQEKIREWETGAAIVRWLVISTVAVVSGGLALYDRFRSHLSP